MQLRTAMLSLSLVPLVATCCASAAARDQVADKTAEPPKLVVLIVIDQFPAYLLPRLAQHLAPRGFRLLMDRGAWYTQAYYPQAATLTGVGHATIATGGLPAGHGIAGNDWYDREGNRQVYCVEDPAHQWVGCKAAGEDGTSPRNLTSTTFSDEWRLAAGFQPRVVSTRT